MNRLCNTTVTNDCNALPVGSNRWFLKRAEEICKKGSDFSFYDFPEISNGYFRQLVYRNTEKLEKTLRTNFACYKLKGYRTVGQRDTVTAEGMGVGSNMESILRTVKQQPPQVHDLKIKFESNLHSILCSKGYTPDPSNKRIYLSKHKLMKNVHASISVYPKTVQIDFGCTFKPVVYDTAGMLEFLIILGRIYQIIFNHVLSDDLVMPDPRNWIITAYHFNRDGRQEYSGFAFHRTVSDFSGGMIRYYTKTFPDGRTRLRYEEIRTVNCNVMEECYRMFWQDVRQSFVTL